MKLKSNLRKRLIKEAYHRVQHLELDEAEWMYAYLDELIDLILHECIDNKAEAVKRKFGVKL